MEGRSGSELELNERWSLGEAAFDAVTKDMAELGPRRIVEFGSGPSSLRLALAFPDAQVLAIEHDATYFDKTLGLLERHPEIQNLELELRPIRGQWHRGLFYRSYEPGPIAGVLDAVIVDGPPWRFVKGREACLHQVFPSLREGGRAYLDDYARPEERRAAAAWVSQYLGAVELRVLRVGHEVCVLTKCKAVRRRFSARAVADHYVDYVEHFAKRTYRRLSA